VVVSGLPASGKSTLARAIAPRLALGVLDKDDFLEALFADEPEVDPHRRSALSRRADAIMESEAKSSPGAVLVSFWRREELSATSGTPTSWLRDSPRTIELHCVCDPEVATARFLTRSRDPNHGDAARHAAQLLHQFKALAVLGPLAIAPVVYVNTEAEVDLDAVVASLNRASFPTVG